MTLSWAEIRDNAIRFQDRWKDARDERAEAQTFLYELLRDVYGVDPRRVSTFEVKVHPTSDSNGYIDMLWPGRILIEMKSRGKSLDKAHEQARRYAFSIEDDEQLPVYIMVCDFARIRLYNLITNQVCEFETSHLSENVQSLSILTEQATKFDFVVDKDLNSAAVDKIAKLYDLLKRNGYSEHHLEVFIVRILFCLFADHTGIFNHHQFHQYIDSTAPNGSDLGGKLSTLFEILDTPIASRMASLPDELSCFPYVDGGMFEENLRIAAFNKEMRETLLDCCAFDWSKISPAIFGAMFQNIMDASKRDTLGEQYTPQHIIMKVLKPLMIDELYDKLDHARGNRTKVEELHNYISTLNILDPACGCGNFLAVAYSVLRHLELDILRAEYPSNDDLPDDFDLHNHITVNVGQFIGIDIEEFPCKVAQASMWLIDHKMNQEASIMFGRPFIRIPLSDSARIYHKNALVLDWKSIASVEKVKYIIGNPPFHGAKKCSPSQRREVQQLFSDYPNSGTLDYVAGWYMKAIQYMHGTQIKAAFVSTTSIIQGEQVATLWKPLIKNHCLTILFGYRPFKWTNDAQNTANVACVIIGFCAFDDHSVKTIFNNDEDETKIEVPMINPYLDGLPVMVFVRRRSTPLSDVPIMGCGNKPIDDGNYLFTIEEMQQFIQDEPLSARWFRKWYGSREFINKKPRFCLWLRNCPPDELRRMPLAMQRVEAVRQFRMRSSDQQTRNLANTPRKFHIENMPTSRYLVITQVSSEHREYIPMGFMNPDVMCSNLVDILPGATLYHFGILTSSMHMIWMRAVCGRLEERYRYSIEVVYNNFPWPTVSPAQKERIEALASDVIAARDRFPTTSYADLYNPSTMPNDLSRAHRRLDNAVKALYGLRANATDEECILALYRRYSELDE